MPYQSAPTKKPKTAPHNRKWRRLLDSLESSAGLASDLGLEHTRMLLAMALLDALQTMESGDRTVH
jgi:hypothetical protein